MQAGMGITDGIIQGKISCFRNKFHKHKEKCSEKRKFLGALCLRSEIFVLIFVSYFLVDRQNEKDRKKEKINALINKVQLRLLDADLVKVDTEENRKITRIKVTSISNLLEIIKDNMDNKNNIDNIVTKMDNLSVLIMDHIEDEDYIRKTNSHIIRTVIDIDTKLEKIKFDIN